MQWGGGRKGTSEGYFFAAIWVIVADILSSQWPCGGQALGVCLLGLIPEISDSGKSCLAHHLRHDAGMWPADSSDSVNANFFFKHLDSHWQFLFPPPVWPLPPPPDLHLSFPWSSCLWCSQVAGRCLTASSLKRTKLSRAQGHRGSLGTHHLCHFPCGNDLWICLVLCMVIIMTINQKIKWRPTMNSEESFSVWAVPSAGSFKTGAGISEEWLVHKRAPAVMPGTVAQEDTSKCYLLLDEKVWFQFLLKGNLT